MGDIQDKIKGYEKNYSEEDFWEKVKGVVKKVGCDLIEKALILYYVAQDPDTPTRVKMLIYGALGYFISPLDAIPDALPGIGFTDDLGVLVGVIALLGMSIKEKHKELARDTLSRWC